MKTLKNSLAGLAFAFAIVAAFAFSSPASLVTYQSISDDTAGTNCQLASGTAPSGCLTTNTGAQCQQTLFGGKFIYAETGCAAPFKRVPNP